jgi:hypothetical protein
MHQPLTAEEVAELTQATQTTAITWRGRCPAHDDQKGNALRFRQDGATLLMVCNAGCTFREIIFELLALQDAAGVR